MSKYSKTLCARLFSCALWSPAGKGLTSWLSFVVSYCEFVYPGSGVVLGILGQVWYLIVSIPDLAPLLTRAAVSIQVLRYSRI